MTVTLSATPTARTTSSGDQDLQPMTITIDKSGVDVGDTDGVSSWSSAALEVAFEEITDTAWALGQQLGREPSSELAHTPGMNPIVTDVPVMMAWRRMIERWAAQSDNIEIICDDPWLFRYFATIDGVQAATAPTIWSARLKFWARGFATRSINVAKLFLLSVRHERFINIDPDHAALLAYGHPSSTTTKDAYFGSIMEEGPNLRRLVHVDFKSFSLLGAKFGERTKSLHAWGNPFYALTLLWTKWRPTSSSLEPDTGWLVRRAAAIEGSTAQATLIKWQIHCQRRWLDDQKPKRVAWPWENHGWERAFVRDLRARGITSIGYQHSVIGRHMLNYAPRSNADGLNSIPGEIFCTGSLTHDQLIEWGIPADRLKVAGARRVTESHKVTYSSDAPVFVALPSDQKTARQLIDYTKRLASASSMTFLVKDHPMTPHRFEQDAHIVRTDVALQDQEHVKGVIYASTTVGLEAIALGLPTYRFRPTGHLAIDILPNGISIPTIGSDDLDFDVFENPSMTEQNAHAFFAPPDPHLWSKLTETRPETCQHP